VCMWRCFGGGANTCRRASWRGDCSGRPSLRGAVHAARSPGASRPGRAYLLKADGNADTWREEVCGPPPPNNWNGCPGSARAGRPPLIPSTVDSMDDTHDGRRAEIHRRSQVIDEDMCTWNDRAVRGKQRRQSALQKSM